MVVSPFPSTLNWLFGVSRNLYNIHIISHSNTTALQILTKKPPGVFSALQHPEPPVQNDEGIDIVELTCRIFWLLKIHRMTWFSPEQNHWTKSLQNFWSSLRITSNPLLGGGFKYVLFSSLFGKIPILTDIFQLGWNHQLAWITSSKSTRLDGKWRLNSMASMASAQKSQLNDGRKWNMRHMRLMGFFGGSLTILKWMKRMKRNSHSWNDSSWNLNHLSSCFMWFEVGFHKPKSLWL